MIFGQKSIQPSRCCPIILNEEEKVLLDKYTIIEASRKRVVYNWLQCFSQESLRQEFEENGLIIDATYGDVAGVPFDPDSSVFAAVAKALR